MAARRYVILQIGTRDDDQFGREINGHLRYTGNGCELGGDRIDAMATGHAGYGVSKS